MLVVDERRPAVRMILKAGATRANGQREDTRKTLANPSG
jgi:hypothetical protein